MSLEDVGKVPGGDALTSFLRVSHNDDGSEKAGGSAGTLAEVLANGHDAGSLQINNLADPTNPQDASTKNYVDTHSAAGASASVGTLASRPAAAGSVGVIYFATDDTTDSTNGTLYLSDGSTWRMISRTLHGLYGVFSVEDYGAVGDGVTDDSGVFRAVAGLVDANRGGTILCRNQKYYWATNVTITTDGTAIVSCAQPGVGSSLSKGGTQIIVNDGITGLTLGSSSATTWRGSRLEGLQFYEKTAGGSSSTVLVKLLRMNNSDFLNCSFGDCTLGKGFMVDGTGDNTQYTNFVRCRFGKCSIAYQQTAANGTSFVSCYFEGSDSGNPPTAGSIGINQLSGDTLKVSGGTRLQGYDTLVVLSGNTEHTIDDTTRYEVFTTQAVHVKGSVSRSYIGGAGDNSLNGSVGSGVVIDAGATDISVNSDIQSVASGRIVDSGTRTRYGLRTDKLVHPMGVGTFVKAGVPADSDFVGVVDGLIAIDSTDGKLYVRYGGAWHFVALT